MATPSMFKVFDANVTRTDEGNNFSFNFPANKEPFEDGLKEAPAFGVGFFEKLVNDGYAELASREVPTRPMSAGSIYQFSDGVVLIHRRDSGAPVHPMYHSCPSGYPEAGEHISVTQRRETAEENLLLFKQNGEVTDVVVPRDAAVDTLESVERLGLRYPARLFDVETIEGPDTVTVYDDGVFLYEVKAFVDVLFEGSRGHNAMVVRSFNDLASTDVIPFDAEGIVNENKPFIHFKRESYFIHPDTDLEIGHPMDVANVFQLQADCTRDMCPSYTNPPYVGPDKVQVTKPHIFYPDGHLTRVLDGLGFKNFEGRWMDIEKQRCEAKLEGKTLINPAYLA